MDNIDSQRYYGDYRARCLQGHQKSGQRCVLCLKKSQEIHHAYYGNDVVGESIFPVCKKCHKLAHTGSNWIYHEDKMRCHNSESFHNKLRRGYLVCRVVVTPTLGKLCYNGDTHSK